MSHKAMHVTPRAVPYVPLTVGAAFQSLTAKQKLYAHYMSRASFAGVPVIASQLSPEALPLLRVLHRVFRRYPVEQFKQVVSTAHGVTSEDVNDFLEYGALVYANLGNYLSFGDSKFIPACSPEAFAGILAAVSADAPPGMDVPALVAAVYDLSEGKLTLAFPPKGVSAYYSGNITAADAELANEFLASKQMDPVNTRVWKSAETEDLTIRLASAQERVVPAEVFKGRAITLEYGDFKEEMSRVVAELTKAQEYAENETQRRMLSHYIEHFSHGDVNAHIESQKEWVKDIGPVVETNIGFIETYRDPSGVRAEWEGFVAVVNEDQSRKYGQLVANAETFIPLLPWGPGFEKDGFSSPDFTSLEVLAFATGGVPAGINIPNYDVVRQTVGFKNVYLGNVVSAINYTEKVRHIAQADWETFKRASVAATSVNVGIHELLGHGTGKLLIEETDGSTNFARDLVDPLSGKPVATWYKAGETFGSVFGAIASSYEECRAEAVSLYLSVQPALLEIFELTTPEAQRETIHILWLKMVHAGLVGLEMYTPETQQWRQAHMRARFCLLQALLRCEKPLVHLSADEEDGVVIRIDADRIATDGVAAIREVLLHLSVNKSVADAARGGAYYTEMTTVSEEFVKYREIVMAHRKPRRQYVQAHTHLAEDGSTVELREYEGSVEGVLQSMVDRHNDIPL